MFKLKKFLLSPFLPLSFILLSFFSISSADETLTLTTYYPSPYGNYNELTATTTLVIPNGANPTTDAAGEIAVDSSAAPGSGIRFYGDAAYTLPGTQSKSFTIATPVAASDYPIWRVPYAITITNIHVQCTGGTNIVGQLDEYNSAGASIVATVDTDITATAGNNANDDGSLSNPGIAAGNYIFWHTTSISGTPTSVTVTFEYTVDQVN